MEDCLQIFSGRTAEWFREKLGDPTRAQEVAWPAIAAGGHVLVSAPTGTGKTLSAFLVFLDRFMTRALKGNLPQELQLIYVSPLKSLAADIRENLRKPLEGIGGQELIHVAIRTGDTTQRERQQMVRKPPPILDAAAALAVLIHQSGQLLPHRVFTFFAGIRIGSQNLQFHAFFHRWCGHRNRFRGQIAGRPVQRGDGG